MRIDDLAKHLKQSYDDAPHGQKNVAVTLFGITYASQLGSTSVAEVVARSGIGKWGPQVVLGVNLAKHVRPLE